ncbi:MAG TPA: hypothetical protein VHQ24_17365 [Lachnospiraceae bacterium]|nr:hypothetical protein [Lachnospiraceae bacterium]
MEVINCYNQKYILQKILYTYRKKYLEYRGPYKLRIIEKQMPTPALEYESIPIFYVETEDQKYQGLLEVSMTDFRKYRVGQCYKRGGVILYTRKENFYYMSKYEDSIIAIRKAINWARLRLSIVLLITLIAIMNIVILILKLIW